MKTVQIVFVFSNEDEALAPSNQLISFQNGSF
jgi:hypothetical protein